MPRGNPQNLVPAIKRSKEEATNGDKKGTDKDVFLIRDGKKIPYCEVE